MRKLFVVGIVSVVVLIAWVLFLNYDLIRFEKEHTSATLPQQDSNTGLNKAGIQNENSQKPLEDADISIESKESPESVSTENNTNTDKGNMDLVVAPIEPQLTPTDTALSLSPETIELYKAYRIIDKEMTKYNTEQYRPMKNYYFTLTERRKEIHNELVNGIYDPPTIIALHEELSEIQAWYDKNSTKMYELQDTVNQIIEKGLSLLKANGYSSYNEFLTVHRKTYQTWKSEQTTK